MSKILDIKGPDDFIRSFNVSRETCAQLETYVELLRKWQKVVNLVSISSLDEIWHRHIGDSAQIVDIVNKSDSPNNSLNWVDIGSGGGFPGLVLAILLADKTDMRFHLVESNGRKCAFLADVVRQLDLSVEIHNCRIEELFDHVSLERVDFISARAVASLDRLFEFMEPFVHSDLRAYFLKGRDVKAELLQAQTGWNFTCKQIESRTSSDGCLLEVSGLQRK
ncbi:MAG: 16S rRNA (guanine(527)-N(7))-methyltransferase RsmG [Hyphomicrobiaceae bacterium]|nr:16S rRNA (guanine(527)-N(7))-methyltransferase RsmG [Hyphomicrobiaceae bacterium]